MERFDELLKELGRLFELPLHPDKRGACLLNVNNTLHVQLEFDSLKERVLIASFLCEVPSGKFRENVLKEALKANNLDPRPATLAYSERNNQLSLFAYLPLSNLDGQKLADTLFSFVDLGESWRSSIENGTIPQVTGVLPKAPSPFDLHR